MKDRQKVYFCISRKCGRELTDSEIKMHMIFCTACSFLAKQEGSKKFNTVREIEINEFNQEKLKRVLIN